MGRQKGIGSAANKGEGLPSLFSLEDVDSFIFLSSEGRPGKAAEALARLDSHRDYAEVGPHKLHDQGHAEKGLALGHDVISSVTADTLDGFAKPIFSDGGKGKNFGFTTTTPTTTTTTTTTTATTIDYVSGRDTPGGYNMELAFKGTWTDAAKAAAYTAAEAISDIVTGDLASYNGIDDIRVTLTAATIDGTGGTWGMGGYDILRAGSNLAATGHVTVDSGDIANAVNMGLMDDLLTHEMLHAMGFGTTWSAMGLVSNFNGDLRFNGTNSTNVYNTLFASIASGDALAKMGVPIETDGGSGAAGKHWDETTFGNEIMTTNLNYSNNVSTLTMAALEDMGYETIYVDQSGWA